MSDTPPLTGGSKLNNLTCGVDFFFVGHPRQVCRKSKENKATWTLPTSNTKHTGRHMMSVVRPQQHSSSSSTAAVMSVAQLLTAQQQQHSSGGDVGGPEETSLVAPATLPFLVCIVNKFHGVAPHRGAASAPSAGCDKPATKRQLQRLTKS